MMNSYNAHISGVCAKWRDEEMKCLCINKNVGFEAAAFGKRNWNLSDSHAESQFRVLCMCLAVRDTSA